MASKPIAGPEPHLRVAATIAGQQARAVDGEEPDLAREADAEAKCVEARAHVVDDAADIVEIGHAITSDR